MKADEHPSLTALERLKVLDAAVQRLSSLHFADAGTVLHWNRQLQRLREGFSESLLRIAVVGTVKSGKSTLINAILGQDLMKRGAGIVTAFITRIRAHHEAGGWVELKSRSQVEREFHDTIGLLPSICQQAAGDIRALDLRRATDRARLADWLHRARDASRHLKGQAHLHLCLLNAYLDGYERLEERLGEAPERLFFQESSLEGHQSYVSEEPLAVCIQDMELRFPIPGLGDQLEIADCQGSDSPNPRHCARLQDYLLGSHLIVFVISGRAGLREADFKLLEFVKTLRMAPNTLFVLNVDLDLHPHPEDLRQLCHRVESELAWMIPAARVYAFSALYHLLQSLGAGAAARERRRLESWGDAQELLQLTTENFHAFQRDLAERAANQREQILLGTGLNRLVLLAATIAEWARAQKELLTVDWSTLSRAVRRLRERQGHLVSTWETVEKALAGIKESFAQELLGAVAEAFDLRDGHIVSDTLVMVERYPVASASLRTLSGSRRLAPQLHAFYIDFRQSLSRHLVEKVNVTILEFAKAQEDHLKARLVDAVAPFWALFANVLEDFRLDLAKLHIDLGALRTSRAPDWRQWERTVPPQFSACLDGLGLNPNLLLVKFGLGRLARFLAEFKERLGRRLPRSVRSDGNPALEEAIALVKAETKAELLEAFQQYRSAFLEKYLLGLLDRAVDHILEEFQTRAEMVKLDLLDFLSHGQAEEHAHLEKVESLEQVEAITATMAMHLERLATP
jgi:hypothetical protein